MALTNTSQQALIDKALAQAKAQGVSEADAQKKIAQTLQGAGYSFQGGSLVKATPVAAPAISTPSPSQPAPVANVAPAMPSATPNTPVAPKAPAAPVINETPVTPEVPKAPETPKVSETSAPAPSASPVVPVQPKAQVASGTVQTAGGSVSSERATEIAKNLTEGTKATPELFSDRETYNKAYGYDAKPEGEKALLDAAWNNVQPKADQIFSQLSSGQVSIGSVPKNAQGNLAVYRFNSVQRYKNYSPSQLASALTSNRDIMFGSQAYLDLEKANPQLVAQANEIRKGNTLVGILSGSISGKDLVNYTNSVGSLDALISSDIKASGVKSVADIIAEIEDVSGTKAKKDKMSSVQDELNTDLAAYKALEDDIDKELSGTGATESYKRALLAQRGKALLNAITAKTDVIDQLKGQISDDLKMAEFAYNERQSQIKAEQAKRDKITEMQFQLYRDEQSRQQQLAYLDAQNQSALELAKAKMKLEGQKLSQVDLGGSVAMVDPTTGKTVSTLQKSMTPGQGVANRYEKVGDQLYDTVDKVWIRPDQIANAPIIFGRQDIGNTNVQTQYTGTGEIVPFTVSQFTTDSKGNVVEREKTVQLDSSIQGKFTAAMDEIMKETDGAIISDTFRTEAQQAGKVANGVSWTMDSAHRKGLAVDLYAPTASIGDSQGQKAYIEKYIKPIMEKYGFEQKTYGKGDYGNFEYTGIGQAEKSAPSSLVDDALAERMLRFGELPSSFAGGTADERATAQSRFMDAFRRGDMDTIKSIAIKSLPTKEKDAYNEAFNRTLTIPSIMKSFSNLSKSGVDIDFTTPYQQTLANLGKSTNPEAQQISRAVAGASEFMSKIRNELFGAALTDMENEKAVAFIVENGDSLPVVMNKLASMQEYAAKAVARTPFIAMGLTPDQLSSSDYVKASEKKLSSPANYITFENDKKKVVSQPVSEYISNMASAIRKNPSAKSQIIAKAKKQGFRVNEDVADTMKELGVYELFISQ